MQLSFFYLYLGFLAKHNQYLRINSFHLPFYFKTSRDDDSVVLCHTESVVALDVTVTGLGLAYFLLPFHTLSDHLFECLILRQINNF